MRKIKKPELKKLKEVELKKEKKKEEGKKLGKLKPEEISDIGKEEKKKEEQIEKPETLDSIAREEKKRKEREELEQLKNLEKNKIFEEQEEFIPENTSPERMENLEEFAEELPAPARAAINENPYAPSKLYGASSGNTGYSLSENYSAKTLAESPSLEHRREIISPFNILSNQAQSSQASYEPKHNQNFNKRLEEQRQEFDDTHLHHTQRKSRKIQ